MLSNWRGVLLTKFYIFFHQIYVVHYDHKVLFKFLIFNNFIRFAFLTFIRKKKETPLVKSVKSVVLLTVAEIKLTDAL